jgi:hypothetical protein
LERSVRIGTYRFRRCFDGQRLFNQSGSGDG